MALSPQDREVERDLIAVASGNFTADVLGPLHERILDRLRAKPEAFLDAFERLFLALARRLLDRYDTALTMADHAREQDFALAEALPDSISGFVRRLEEQRRQLRALIGEPLAQR
ncbi:MAG: hypothetical protein ACREFS_10515 [Acetobacteraceae bacterium]